MKVFESSPATGGLKRCFTQEGTVLARMGFWRQLHAKQVVTPCNKNDFWEGASADGLGRFRPSSIDTVIFFLHTSVTLIVAGNFDAFHIAHRVNCLRLVKFLVRTQASENYVPVFL